MIFYYYVKEDFPKDYSFDEDDLFEFVSQYSLYDEEFAAAECAEDYYDNYDGWESSWPRTIILYDNQKNLIGEFLTDVEYRASFTSSKKTP